MEAAVLDFLFSSSEDEEFISVLSRCPRTIKRRFAHFEELDETAFKTRLRLSKQFVSKILEEIQHELSHKTDKNNAISPMNQLLLTLRFYATGFYLLTAGDLAGVSKTSSHKIVHRVTNAIAALRPIYVKFPTQADEIKREQLKFFDIARFPRVVGCTDCTHVKIQSYGGDNAEYFRNRKGYFSINVQAICNANLELTDVVARWQGSVHDSKIFNNSRIRALFESGTFVNGLLLGDGEYSLRPYLMTPLQNPVTRAEITYNKAHIKTRNTIERVFGIWKRRFPILSLGSRFQSVETTLNIIVATAVLHNIARINGETLPPDDPS